MKKAQKSENKKTQKKESGTEAGAKRKPSGSQAGAKRKSSGQKEHGETYAKKIIQSNRVSKNELLITQTAFEMRQA